MILIIEYGIIMAISDLKNSSKMRIQNQLNTLREMRRRKQVSNAELSRIFNVPQTTTLRILSGLESLGCISKVTGGKQKKKVGKPAVEFEINSAAGAVIAVDAGVRNTSFAIVDYTGNISAYEELITKDIISDYVGRIAEKVNKLKAQTGLTNELISIVIGISGSVSKTHIKTRFLPEEFDLKGKLENALGAEVHIENDANLAIIAEQQDAAIYSPTSIFCILDRNNIGTGIIIDGKLYRGFCGSAGEIYSCSPKGNQKDIAELLASPKLQQQIPERFEFNEQNHIYRKILKLAERGNDMAEKTIGQILNILADQIVRSVSMLDPEYLIITGEIAKAGKECHNELLKKNQREKRAFCIF